ncbi:MAG: hypothetical protein KAJ19_22290 [Gammaproteobacteria bacterium]|nr:hypothetical protein [Gammaproteobacteria bacterium]
MVVKLNEDQFGQLVKLLNGSSHAQQLTLLRCNIKPTALKAYLKELKIDALKKQTGL